MAKLTLQDMRDYDEAAAVIGKVRMDMPGHQHAVWLKLHNADMYCRTMAERALDDVLNGEDLLSWWKRVFRRR